MRTIDLNKVSKEIRLDNGDRIVMLDMLAADKSLPSDSIEQNIYRLSASGEVMWQVSASGPVYDRSPFTGIGIEDDGVLHAYRWDGTEYIVDVQSGKAQPHRLSK
jgi:hypothetical protein